MNYVLNLLSGVMHRYPANEACNVDDMRSRQEFETILHARQSPRFRRFCRRCFRDDQVDYRDERDEAQP